MSGAVDKSFQAMWLQVVWQLPTNEAMPGVGTRGRADLALDGLLLDGYQRQPHVTLAA